MKLLGLVLVLVPAIAGAQDHPRFFITPAREAAWARMKRDYEASRSGPATAGGRMYKLIKANADSGTRYSDIGTWGTWMYHVTGDSAYVAKAWKQINTKLVGRLSICNNSGIAADWSRENFWQYVWMYDWLYPGLTTQQRSDMLTKLNAIGSCIHNTANGFSYYIGYDSDQTNGDYMGAAMLYVSTSSYNPTAATIWNDKTKLLGGFTATATNYATHRNAITKLVTVESAGGEWRESFEYNYGTIKTLMLGAEAIKTWTGVDHFPEITAWQQEAATQHMHMLTPGSGSARTLQPFLWGDTQNPRQYRAFYYYETALVLAGVTNGTSAGPFIQDWVLDREAASGITTLDPFARAFLVFDPYATRGDWTTLPLTDYSSGRQMYLARTGWAASDKWFTALFSPMVGDHPISAWGSFQLWKDSAWAITHTQSYGGVGIDSRGTNGLSFAGVGVGYTFGPIEYRGAVATRTASTPVNYSYAVGTMGGDMWGNHRYGSCPSYIMEHTRSLVWLHDLDTIVVYDRANSKATTFPTATLNAAFQTWSQSRPRKELWVHTIVSPTQGSNYSDWIYDGAAGHHTRVTHLLPTSSTKTIESEASLWYSAGWFMTGDVVASERQYHVKIVPTATNQWEPFLNVWDAYGTGTPAMVTLVEDAANAAQGALVTKGSTNVLALFNGIRGRDVPGPMPVKGGYWDWVTTEPTASTILSGVRLRARGYTLTFDAGPNPTQALFFDLNPAVTWALAVNGGPETSLTVGADGVAAAQVATAGRTTLVVKATSDHR